MQNRCNRYWIDKTIFHLCISIVCRVYPYRSSCKRWIMCAFLVSTTRKMHARFKYVYKSAQSAALYADITKYVHTTELMRNPIRSLKGRPKCEKREFLMKSVYHGRRFLFISSSILLRWNLSHFSIAYFTINFMFGMHPLDALNNKAKIPDHDIVQNNIYGSNNENSFEYFTASHCCFSPFRISL